MDMKSTGVDGRRSDGWGVQTQSIWQRLKTGISMSTARAVREELPSEVDDYEFKIESRRIFPAFVSNQYQVLVITRQAVVKHWLLSRRRNLALRRKGLQAGFHSHLSPKSLATDLYQTLSEVSGRGGFVQGVVSIRPLERGCIVIQNHEPRSATLEGVVSEKAIHKCLQTLDIFYEEQRVHGNLYRGLGISKRGGTPLFYEVAGTASKSKFRSAFAYDLASFGLWAGPIVGAWPIVEEISQRYGDEMLEAFSKACQAVEHVEDAPTWASQSLVDTSQEVLKHNG